MKSRRNTLKRCFLGFGVALIVIQLISVFGISCADTGIWPGNKTLWPPIQSRGDSTLNIKEMLFAFVAGFDRFLSGFGDLIYHLRDERRALSAIQYASAYIREALGCSHGGSFGLVIYDFFVLLSYCTAGIVGAILLTIAKRIAAAPGMGSRNNVPPAGVVADTKNASAWVCTCGRENTTLFCEGCGKCKY